MHKPLPIFGLGLLFAAGALAADVSSSTSASSTPTPAPVVAPAPAAAVASAPVPGPVATVRVALVRDVESFEKTIESVFQTRYEGNIRVVKTSNGKFTAINTLDIEDFLKGVIGHEMSPSCPIEALKA